MHTPHASDRLEASGIQEVGKTSPMDLLIQNRDKKAQNRQGFAAAGSLPRPPAAAASSSAYPEMPEAPSSGLCQ